LPNDWRLAGLKNVTELKKTEIIHHLAQQKGYRHYLELCTSTTGDFYREIDKSRFLTCRRLMYNCPGNFDDGLPIDYRCEYLEIEPAFHKLRLTGQSFNICLVDGYHTYDCAPRDLAKAYALLVENGALVVHDCLPPSPEAANPTWVSGEWCGVSYKVFLDFVVNRDDIYYYTIDADYGCGVIVKDSRFSARATRLLQRVRRHFADDARAQVIRGWLEIGGDFRRAFEYFNAHKVTLLQLISVEQFLRGVRSESG
jgi:hypothetical protein